ncbi:MAG: oxidoreductase [Pseudomonadota bacterium]
MPSLIRLVIVLAIIGALVYGAMVSLALFVEPNPREMSIKIKSERLNR